MDRRRSGWCPSFRSFPVVIYMRVQGVRFRRCTAYAISAGSASTFQHSGYAPAMHMVRYTGLQPESRLPPQNVEAQRQDSTVATMWGRVYASWLGEEGWQGGERMMTLQRRGGWWGRASAATARPSTG